MGLLDRFRLPEKQAPVGPDEAATTHLHRRLIRQNVFLCRLYQDFYRALRAELPGGEGTWVEIGSGGGFLKEFLPAIVTSDILQVEGVDRCFSVEQMPFADGSVDAFVMLNTFHHFPDPAKALAEMARTLRPGGRMVMIEPANTLWGRFIYRHFHHEAFDPRAGWGFVSTGPLSSANGAQPWIVFVRDRAEFERRFPALRVRSARCHTPFRYLLSGGLSYRPFVPAWSYPCFSLLDRLLAPLGGAVGMFTTVVVEKPTR